MTVLLVFAFSMLLLLLATLAKRLWQEGRVPMMRLTENHQLPELTLQRSQRFHVFLSHTWSSAQDQNAVLKRQLLQLLPGCKAFLDVCAKTSAIRICRD